MILLWPFYIKSELVRKMNKLFTKASSGRARVDGFKLKEGVFRTDINKLQ